MHPHANPAYIHHQKPGIAATLREVVFGMEDGMVSTMGAITGIAVGSGSHSFVVLSGFVILAVESISMGVGSYLSNRSEYETEKRMLSEEKDEIQKYLSHETKEMEEFFVRDGWPKTLAKEMAGESAKNPKLMLTEMAYRELRVFPHHKDVSVKNGIFMWGSYILGGTIPLLPYLLFSSVEKAFVPSLLITFAALFTLGAYTTKFSHRLWWKAGLEMLVLAGLAAIVGYAVGRLFGA